MQCSGSCVRAFLLLSWSDASEMSVASVASVASDISVTSSSGTWKQTDKTFSLSFKMMMIES